VTEALRTADALRARGAGFARSAAIRRKKRQRAVRTIIRRDRLQSILTMSSLPICRSQQAQQAQQTQQTQQA
jgi:hypothetical protein